MSLLCYYVSIKMSVFSSKWIISIAEDTANHFRSRKFMKFLKDEERLFTVVMYRGCSKFDVITGINYYECEIEFDYPVSDDVMKFVCPNGSIIINK